MATEARLRQAMPQHDVVLEATAGEVPQRGEDDRLRRNRAVGGVAWQKVVPDTLLQLLQGGLGILTRISLTRLVLKQQF